VGFGLLRANGSDNTPIGYFAIIRYLFTLDEVNCVRTGGLTSANTLGEATNFVGKPMDPFDFGGALRELVVFEGLASDGIQYRVGDVLAQCGGQQEDTSSKGGCMVGAR
jgi:hypothetical protein